MDVDPSGATHPTSVGPVRGRSANESPDVSTVLALEALLNPTVEDPSLEFGSGVG